MDNKEKLIKAINELWNSEIDLIREELEQVKPIRAFIRSTNPAIEKITDKQVDYIEKYFLKENVSKNYENFLDLENVNDCMINLLIAAKASGKTYTIVYYILYRWLSDKEVNVVCYRENKLRAWKDLQAVFIKVLNWISYKTGLDWKKVIEIKSNNQYPSLIMKGTKQEIRFEGLEKDRDNIGQGLDFAYGKLTIVWVDEFLKKGGNELVTDEELFGIIDTWISAITRWNPTNPKLILSSNPWTYNHKVLEEFYHPFIIQHSQAEREEKHKQEYIDKDFMSGLGLFVFDSSYHVNTKLPKEALAIINYWKENNIEKYRQMGLGLNIASTSEAYGKNPEKLKSVKAEELIDLKFDEFIAGGDIGKGYSNTCFNFIGIILGANGYKDCKIYYLEEFYWDNKDQGRLYEDEKMDKVLKFYVDCVNKYTIKVWKKTTIYIDPANQTEKQLLDRIIREEGLPFNIWNAHKQGYNDLINRVINVKNLLAEDRIICNSHLHKSLKYELDIATVDLDGKREKSKKQQLDRLDALDYSMTNNSWNLHYQD